MDSGASDIQRVLSLLPSGLFLMTGAFEHARAGALVTGLIQCSLHPPCVAVALLKGNRLSPIVRDSRAFALCAVNPTSKLLLRKFAPDTTDTPAAPSDPDPFDSFEVCTLVSRAPVLSRSTAAIDCEVIRHFDFEGDHELYIGQVVGVRESNGCPPGN